MFENQPITFFHSPKKPRLYYIDNLRALACFLVLLTHSTMPAKDAASEGIWMFALSFIGSPSSELFLALSGTVLLPVKRGIRDFYRRRFLKLLPPVIFWSIVGTLACIPLKGISMQQALTNISYIPLRPVIGVYWFVYVMVGLYLFAPIISAYLKTASKRQIELYLGLWAVTLVMPWLYGLIADNFDQAGSHYWMLNYFGGFLGYWILGYYLNRYPIHIGRNRTWLTLCALCVLYPLAILLMKLRGIDAGAYTDNLQLGSAVLVAMLYTLLQNVHLPDRAQAFFTGLAKYSFGIYLIHYYTRDMFWQLFDSLPVHIHTFPRTFLIAALMMGSCWCLMWLLSRLPYGKYITGA